MLKTRVITAICCLLPLIAAVWFDEPLPWFTILVAIWGLLAAFEFYRMVAASEAAPLTYFGMLWILFFIITPHFDYDFLPSLLLTSAVVLSLICMVLRKQREKAFTGWVWTVAGILYIGFLLSYLVALRLEAGKGWVFLALFATFGCDIAAFLFGRALGRHRMAPRISPKKTWEGAVAGVFGSVIVSVVVVSLFNLPLGYGQAVLLGFLVSIFAQFGDLVESLLKRNVGVKESGRLMPGHGGLLDRMDSVVFAGVVVYFYYVFVVL